MKTLYVSDLDGTLLNRNSTISAYAKQHLNALLDNGLQFTFATARSMYSAEDKVNGLRLQLPMIIYNGAGMVLPNRELFYHKGFHKELAHQLLQTMFARHQYPFVYAFIDGVERVSYMEQHLHEGGWHYLRQRENDPRMRSVKSKEELLEGAIFYITCIDSYEALLPFYAMWKDEPFTLLFHQEIYRQEYWLEILAPKVSKAQAILELKKRLGVQRIVSFGDAINDRSMFEISDQGIAVSNAVDALKEIADEVTLSNDEDGVVKWLCKNAQI